MKENVFSQPRIESGYTLGTHEVELFTETGAQVSDMLTSEAGAFRSLRDLIEEWARGNVEPSEGDFWALASVAGDVAELMEATARFVDKQATIKSLTD